MARATQGGFFQRWLGVSFLRIGFLVGTLVATALHAEVNFGREILPILSENCLACHGQDESNRKADLRLDTREGAMAVIRPGKAAQSEVWRRIISQDADEVMPPPNSHKAPLSAPQRKLIEQWINEGAPWGRHWALELPRRQPHQGHVVDYWVRRGLRAQGMEMAPRASDAALLRRLSLDLTGLPPREGEVLDAGTVDRLLASPHFGERMAMWWLDLARYADTDGFQSDATRSNWPWRDWVVEAFNANLPFDRFTLLQFAGDLLPEAGPAGQLATCFHRNHMTNGEGGRDKEESRVDYVIDRVNTMGTAWMGLTLGCAQCHTHKFDPITHRDYYALSAFFNSIDEDGAAGGGAKPYLSWRSPHAARAVAEEQALVERMQQRELKVRDEARRGPFVAWLAQLRQSLQAAAPRGWLPLRGVVSSSEGSVLTWRGDASVLASGPNPRQDDYRLRGKSPLRRIGGVRLEVLPVDGRLGRGSSGEFILTDLKLQVARRGSAQVRDVALADAVADLEAGDKTKAREYGPVKGTLDDDPRNGWTTAGKGLDQAHVAVYALREPLDLESDDEVLVELRQRSTQGERNLAAWRLSLCEESGDAVRSLRPTPRERLGELSLGAALDDKLRGELFEQFLLEHEPHRVAQQQLRVARAQLAEAKTAAGELKVMVLAQRKEPRETHVLVRGVWDKKGERVDLGVPEAVAAWPKGLPRDRVGLAKWLTSANHPLTARVLVNHLWQMIFGQGLVRTADDFGVQGQPPTHPELLDALAIELREGGWDIKRLLRLIVSSQTYAQSSLVDAAKLARDPQNRWLGRGARFRMPAWMLRDAALASAGLLHPALGGPPVRPYQPPGVWEEIFMGRFTYEPSLGSAQYRRTLYAFWRRSIAPTFLFDSAQRRVCEVAAMRTNTPLQALTRLNDFTIVESARALGTQLVQRGGVGALPWLFRRVLCREPQARELDLLATQYGFALERFGRHPQEAGLFLGLEAGQEPDDKQAQRAAGAHVATLLLNLDEALNRE